MLLRRFDRLRLQESRIIGWLLMGMAMSLLLASIISSGIEPSVAVPIASMFLVSGIAVFARAQWQHAGKRHEERRRERDPLTSGLLLSRRLRVVVS